MGRLLLLASALFGVGVAMSGTRSTATKPAPPAPVETPAAGPTVAFHPGEPSLVLDATQLTRGANGHFVAEVSVGGRPVEMVVDTGATVVALSTADAQQLGISFDPMRFAVVGTGASGPVRGQAVTLDDVAVGGRHVAGVAAVVLDGLETSLLGQSYLRRLQQVSIDGDAMTLR